MNPSKTITKKLNINVKHFADMAEMRLIEQRLLTTVKGHNQMVSDIGKHLIASGGKRLRPLLTILSSKHFEAQQEDVVAAGTAIELVHMASLVHDDIIDKATLRRGQPSVYACWGANKAVLMGDFLFAKAFKILIEQKLYATLHLLVSCIEDMCDGEIDQDRFILNVNQSIADYYTRIRQKTACLICVCCSAGALIGQANPPELYALEQFGLHLGYAFQIIDDILDFVGTESVLGKPIGSDLAQGNLTLPVLVLLDDEQWSSWLVAKLQEGHLCQDDIDSVQQALYTSGALSVAFNEARLHVNRAKATLAQLPPSPYTPALAAIADRVLSSVSLDKLSMAQETAQ